MIHVWFIQWRVILIGYKWFQRLTYQSKHIQMNTFRQIRRKNV